MNGKHYGVRMDGTSVNCSIFSWIRKVLVKSINQHIIACTETLNNIPNLKIRLNDAQSQILINNLLLKKPKMEKRRTIKPKDIPATTFTFKSSVFILYCFLFDSLRINFSRPIYHTKLTDEIRFKCFIFASAVASWAKSVATSIDRPITTRNFMLAFDLLCSDLIKLLYKCLSATDTFTITFEQIQFNFLLHLQWKQWQYEKQTKEKREKCFKAD